MTMKSFGVMAKCGESCNKGGDYLCSLLFICPLSFPSEAPSLELKTFRTSCFLRLHPTQAPGSIGAPGLPCSQSLYSLRVHKFYHQMTYFKQRNSN